VAVGLDGFCAAENGVDVEGEDLAEGVDIDEGLIDRFRAGIEVGAAPAFDPQDSQSKAWFGVDRR
jgi:hypothetical protein